MFFGSRGRGGACRTSGVVVSEGLLWGFIFGRGRGGVYLGPDVGAGVGGRHCWVGSGEDVDGRCWFQ